jgi:hypothetical protein
LRCKPYAAISNPDSAIILIRFWIPAARSRVAPYKEQGGTNPHLVPTSETRRSAFFYARDGLAFHEICQFFQLLSQGFTFPKKPLWSAPL